MPLGYQAIWLLLMSILVVSREITHYGWPLPSSAQYISEQVLVVLIGAYFWGWIFWKFWLYKKFPKK
jgi:hypothetical protein